MFERGLLLTLRQGPIISDAPEAEMLLPATLEKSLLVFIAVSSLSVLGQLPPRNRQAN